jgi:hypothetical protein
MVRIPTKQIDNIKAYNIQVFKVPLTVASQNYDITTTLNAFLLSIDPSLVDTYSGSATSEGLMTATKYNSSKIRNSLTRVPLQDNDGKDLNVRISRISYFEGITSNIQIGYCSPGCSLTNCRLRYISTSKTFSFSNNEGASFGPSADLSTALNGDSFLIRSGDGLEYIVITLLGVLPVSDIIEGLELIDTKYNLGFFHYIDGIEYSWVNTELVDVDFNTALSLQLHNVPFDALLESSRGG